MQMEESFQRDPLLTYKRIKKKQNRIYKNHEY